VGGTPEAVVDSETGYLVPPGDPATLAIAIRSILSDPVLAGKMGVAGQARVRQEFSVETMAQTVNQIYIDLLKRHNLKACQS